MISVLLIDDEPGILEICKIFLEMPGSITVDTAISATVALEKLKSTSYDVIVSDYQLPEMDGISLLKTLRMSGNSTPFIIFTGKGREEVVIDAINNGADFYIQKGGDPRSQFAELSNAINAAAARVKTEEALQRANRKLNLLTSITRHDILNQVTVLLGYLDLALVNSENPQTTEFLLKGMSAAETIKSRIEFTRAYESIGVQKPQWQKLVKAIPLNQVPPAITLTTELQDISIFADPMLGLVFSNLLDNSLRHGQRVTTIRVSREKTGKDLMIIWEDNGVGILPDMKERIFDRGYGKNMGFGLFLAREILGITGMTIHETGKSGIGARFEIRVPDGTYRTGSGNE